MKKCSNRRRTGLSVMLRGMKQIENIDLTAIVTVADDGEAPGDPTSVSISPPMGDVRNVMCAMAEEERYLYVSYELSI